VFFHSKIDIFIGSLHERCLLAQAILVVFHDSALLNVSHPELAAAETATNLYVPERG
jgi:hypothetical protein